MNSAYIIWPRRAGRATLRKQAASPPVQGWAAQQLKLPASWYQVVASNGGVSFPISGDATADWQAMRHAHDTPRPTHP